MREVVYFPSSERLLKRWAWVFPLLLLAGAWFVVTYGAAVAAIALSLTAVWIVVDVKRLHRDGILRLDSEGVHLRGVGLVPWSDIAGVRQSAYSEERRPSWKYGLLGQAAGPVVRSNTAGRVLELELRDKQAFLHRLPPWRRYVAQKSVLLHAETGLKVDLTLADADPEVVARLIQEGVERVATGNAAEPAAAHRRRA